MGSWYVEQRRWPRVEINAPGKIILLSRGLRVKEEVHCVVLDVSEGGAQLSATSPIEEKEFYLEMDTAPGALRLCSVVRRINQSRVGVKFI